MALILPAIATILGSVFSGFPTLVSSIQEGKARAQRNEAREEKRRLRKEQRRAANAEKRASSKQKRKRGRRDVESFQHCATFYQSAGVSVDSTDHQNLAESLLKNGRSKLKGHLTDGPQACAMVSWKKTDKESVWNGKFVSWTTFFTAEGAAVGVLELSPANAQGKLKLTNRSYLLESDKSGNWRVVDNRVETEDNINRENIDQYLPQFSTEDAAKRAQETVSRGNHWGFLDDAKTIERVCKSSGECKNISLDDAPTETRYISFNFRGQAADPVELEESTSPK